MINAQRSARTERPADAVARVVMIGRIAAGEITEEVPSGIRGAAGGAARSCKASGGGEAGDLRARPLRRAGISLKMRVGVI